MLNYKKAHTFFLIFALWSISNNYCFCQNTPSAPTIPTVSVPSISSPTVPTVSNPTFSNSGTQNTAQSTTITNSSNSSATNSFSKTKTNSTSNGSSSLSAASAALSASGLQNITSLLGTGDTSALSTITGLSGLSDFSSTSTSQSYSTNLLLTQILEKLNLLAEKVEGTSLKSNQTVEVGKQGQLASPGSILRFKINTVSLLEYCQTVFISEPERDGSFLLTTDVTYQMNNVKRTETCYLLFKAQNTSTFDVAFSLQQDTENTKSYLYKLMEKAKKPFQATRTGNLVSLRITEDDFYCDLLLNIAF